MNEFKRFYDANKKKFAIECSNCGSYNIKESEPVLNYFTKEYIRKCRCMNCDHKGTVNYEQINQKSLD
ncbi:hypothetical protein MZM54_03385 [[Brevibacterium] frigoritolerans]|nr:hypothetical protein [Peribacillus frigoritolerans]